MRIIRNSLISLTGRYLQRNIYLMRDNIYVGVTFESPIFYMFTTLKIARHD